MLGQSSVFSFLFGFRTRTLSFLNNLVMLEPLSFSLAFGFWAFAIRVRMSFSKPTSSSSIPWFSVEEVSANLHSNFLAISFPSENTETSEFALLLFVLLPSFPKRLLLIPSCLKLVFTLLLSAIRSLATLYLPKLSGNFNFLKIHFIGILLLAKFARFLTLQRLSNNLLQNSHNFIFNLNFN